MFIGPNIINDGLVVSLDAANSKSYPGSGTTWYDLSGENNNATLLNTPTFSNLNGGSLNFDGVNEGGQISSNSLINSSTITIDTWIRLDTGFNGGQIVARDDTSNTGNFTASRVFQWTIGGDRKMNIVLFNSSNSIIFIHYREDYIFQNSTWYNLVLVVGNGTLSAYNNSEYFFNTTFSGTFNTSSPIPLYIATREERLLACINADIPIVRYYNRALSKEEIQQNYNATKGRFGL